MKTALLASLVFLSGVALADTYKVDTAASRVEWKAGKKIGSFHNGNIKIKSGTVETDAKGMVKAADVTVDMKTIADEDLTDPAYNKKLVGHLSSDDFFNVEKFPESKFVLKSIKAKGAKGEFEATGDLTIIGKTESVTFPAKVSVDKGVLNGSGVITIERLKWGLQYGSGSIFKSLTADKIINDTFELKLSIVAKK
jgi:polyisoprenoid-binding protein YceI